MFLKFSSRVFVCLVVCFAAADSFAADEPAKVVMLGDSITHGTRPGVSAEQTFASVVHDRLNADGMPVEVFNVGIGGERTDQALKRLDRDVIAKQPRVVVIMYGTNDSYVDQGKKQSRISADAYEQNLRELVARVRAADAEALLMTEPRWGETAGNNGAGEHPNVRLEQFMQRCRLVAKEMQVPLVDNYAVWTARQKEGHKLGEWTTDACHPNAAGHRVIAEELVGVLLKTLGLPLK